MAKIVDSVFEEPDYNKFKKLKDNRDVYENRKRHLIESFQEKVIKNPIIVNRNMEIIDGQGRFEALKELGLPVQYIIDANAGIEECQLLNMYNSKWSQLDFAKSLAGGNTNYQRLLDTIDATGFNISEILRITNHGGKTGHGKEKDNFKRGLLLFTESDAVMARSVKQTMQDIKEALAYSKRTNGAFLVGVKVMYDHPAYDHAHMIQNCKKCRTSFVQASGLEAMLKEFERIYNYKRATSIRVYFSDYMRNRGANVRNYDTSITDYQRENVSTLK